MTHPLSNDAHQNMINISDEGVMSKRQNKKGSASSQGSGRSNRDVHRLHSSSSSGQSDDERTSASTKKRTQRKSRRPAFSTEEDDDERTDSADEGIEEAPSFKETNRPFFSLATSFSSAGPSTFSPAILKPLSPTMLPVGYGSELLGTRVQSALPTVERDRTPTLDSPHPSESGQVSSDALSPEIAIAQEPSSVNSDQDRRIVTSAPLPPPSVPGTAGTTSILPSPSLPATNTALPFAQWWGQPAIYSPFCGTSGSIASTPVATSEGHPFYPPGTGTILQAIICQEIEGLLIVNIRWRNKTYSGSLIDTTHHQWAPPRLSEGAPDAPIQLQFHASHDSEKEAVDVVIDEEEKEKENEDQVKDVAMEINEEGVVKSDLLKVDEAPENQYSDVTDTSDNENTDKTKSIDPSTIINKPPNGIQIPSILTPPTVSGDDKPKPTPSLPSFDAVKSPQPQLGREETKSNKSRDTTPPPPPTANHTVQFNNLSNSVIVPNETKSLDHHHNLNTLVDVAASMKPVEDDEQPKQNNSKESHDVIKSTYNYHPPGGNESDSSGSGSLSPAKKKTHPFHQDKKKGAETTDLSKTSRDDKQPDTPALTTMPFQFNLALQPISPGGDSEQPQQQQEKEHEPSSNKNQSKSNYWSPMTSSSELDGHYPPNKELDYRPTIDNPGVLVPSLMALESNNPNNNLQSVSHSVIQDKVKVPPRKRKLQSYNESNKRPSSPIKDQEMMPRINKPLPPLPSSLAPSNRVSSEPVVMSTQDMKTPPGFVYDPSLPMSLDYQLIAFERQKAAEEKQKDDRKSPKSKRIRSGEPDMMRHKTTPSPPIPFKRIVPPGIIPSDHMIHGRNMSIKQEPVARPGRPPSKGNHSSKQIQQTKKITSRSKNDLISIKKEPSDTPTQWPPSHQSFLSMPGLPPPLGLNLPPGVTMTSPTPGQPSATPLVHGVHVLHPQNWPPPPHVGAIQSNNKSNKHDTQHRGDLQIHPGGARRTPSPNPRKSHEWLGAPHPSGLPHVITSAPMKQEHLSGRPSNQSHPDSKPHLSSVGHLRMGTGRHHASNKHDSSRHSQSSSSHPPTQPSPTHPGLRSNGVGPTIVNPSSSEELIKMQLQLEALQKAGVSVPMPSTLPPQELMMWQSRAAAQLAAMGQLPVDQALQMQLAMQQQLTAAAVAQQQQQQQQQNEAAAMANFQAIAAAQGMQAGIIPFMQPMPGFPTTPGGIGMVPFTLHPQPKRDS